VWRTVSLKVPQLVTMWVLQTVTQLGFPTVPPMVQS